MVTFANISYTGYNKAIATQLQNTASVSYTRTELKAKDSLGATVGSPMSPLLPQLTHDFAFFLILPGPTICLPKQHNAHAIIRVISHSYIVYITINGFVSAIFNCENTMRNKKAHHAGATFLVFLKQH